MGTHPRVIAGPRDGMMLAVALSLCCSGTASGQEVRRLSIHDAALLHVARLDTSSAQTVRSAPSAFPRMYVAFGLLQAVDAHSTIVTLKGGAKEANPLIGGLAGNPAALVAVKTASAAGTLYCVERLRKKNRVAAAVTMAALNSAYAVVVMNNARVAAKINSRF
jgi:hypothetical protein